MRYAAATFVFLSLGCTSSRSPDATLPEAGFQRTDARASDVATDDASSDDAAVNADAEPEDASSPPRNPLDGAGQPSLIQGGFQFLEGPVWREAEGRLLFSDIPANAIYALVPPSTITTFRPMSNNSNGLANDAAGLLLAAEHGARRVSRTMADGDIVAVAERHQGMRLNSPNDIAVRRSDGTIYFTDPPWGLEGRPRELGFNGLFRVDPAGGLFAEWEAPLDVRPNGVVLSPDESRLYVADDQHAEVLVFDVTAGGALENRRRFVGTDSSPDGITVDSAGNLYASTRAGIEVFAPDGSRWGAIAFPEQPANCELGGAARTTLYVTARTGLYRVELQIPGL